MSASARLRFAASTIPLALAAACHGSSGATPDDGLPNVALPAAVDASFPGNDSAVTQDRRAFFCGTLSGAFTGKLVCDHVFPDLDWTVAPGSAYVTIAATQAVVDAGSSPVFGGPLLGLQILTPGKISPLTETCATLPPNSAGAFKAPFTASFTPPKGFRWSAACGSATQVLPGTSFDLVITSGGALCSDSCCVDPLDASADAYNWANVTSDVISNSFHGTLKATLVNVDGGMPLFVDMTF